MSKKTINFTRISIPQFFWLTPACASPVLLEAHRWFGEAPGQTPRQEPDPQKHDGESDDQQFYDHVYGDDGDGDEFTKALDQTCLQIHCFSLFGEELFQSLIAIIIEIAICHCQCIIIMIHRSPSKVQVARVLIDMANTIYTWQLVSYLKVIISTAKQCSKNQCLQRFPSLPSYHLGKTSDQKSR